MKELTIVEKNSVTKLLEVFSTCYKLNYKHFLTNLTYYFNLLFNVFKQKFQYINIISLKGAYL